MKKKIYLYRSLASEQKVVREESPYVKRQTFQQRKSENLKIFQGDVTIVGCQGAY